MLQIFIPREEETALAGTWFWCCGPWLVLVLIACIVVPLVTSIMDSSRAASGSEFLQTLIYDYTNNE